jgi:hypothetical protein
MLWCSGDCRLGGRLYVWLSILDVDLVVLSIGHLVVGGRNGDVHRSDSMVVCIVRCCCDMKILQCLGRNRLYCSCTSWCGLNRTQYRICRPTRCGCRTPLRLSVIVVMLDASDDLMQSVSIVLRTHLTVAHSDDLTYCAASSGRWPVPVYLAYLLVWRIRCPSFSFWWWYVLCVTAFPVCSETGTCCGVTTVWGLSR